MAAVQEEEYSGPALAGHDKMYIGIGLGLGVLTAIEGGLYYAVRDHGLSNSANIPALLVLAFAKFIIVAAFFMHLKFDTPIFRRLFAGGAILAGFCYVGVLSAFGVFHGVVHWFAYVAAVIAVIIIASRGGTADHGAANDESPAPSHH